MGDTSTVNKLRAILELDTDSSKAKKGINDFKYVLKGLHKDLRTTKEYMKSNKTDVLKSLGIDKITPSQIKKKIQMPELKFAPSLDTQAFANLKNALKDVVGLEKMDLKGSNLYRQRAKDVKLLNKNLGLTKKQLRAVKAEQKGMNFNFLTLLFAGMMLKRIGTALTRFVLPAMDKLNGVQLEGQRAILGMSAGYEFLKYTMFEAFTSGKLFQSVVETVLRWSENLSELIQKYPRITDAIALVGEALITLGTIAMFKSSVIQVGMMTKALFGPGGASGLISKIADIKGNLEGLSGAIGAGLTIKLAIDSFKLFNEDGNSLVKRLSLVLTAAGAGAAIGFSVGGVAGAGVGLLIGIGAGILINLLDIGIENNIGEKLKNIIHEFPNMLKDAVMGGDPFTQALSEIGQYSAVPQESLDSWNTYYTAASNSAGLVQQSVDEKLIQGTFPVLGESITSAGTVFDEKLKTPIEDWANTVTTKTVIIKYKEEGRPKGVGSLLTPETKEYKSSFSSGE